MRFRTPPTDAICFYIQTIPRAPPPSSRASSLHNDSAACNSTAAALAVSCARLDTVYRLRRRNARGRREGGRGGGRRRGGAGRGEARRGEGGEIVTLIKMISREGG